MRLYCPFTKEKIDLPHNEIEIELVTGQKISVRFHLNYIRVSGNQNSLYVKPLASNLIEVSPTG